jgi:hypothetical protein
MSLVPVTQALAPLGPDDSFEFRNLRPGLYQLSVVGAALQMQGVPVSLNDQHVTGYVLTVPQSAVQATVSVSATVAGGEPLPMFPFRLMTPLEPPYKAPHRNFSIPLNSENTSSVAGPVAVVAGEYRAVIGWGAGPGLPEGYSVESVRAGTIDLLSENLVLAPGDKAQIHVVLKVSSPPPGRRVAGRVKSAAVINAARIGVTGRITYVAAVGADGTFEFPHVIPGRYLVQIFPDNSSAAGAAIVGNLVMAGYELTSLEIPAALPSFKISGRGLGEEELRRKGRLGPGPVVAVLSEPARSAAEPPGFRPGHFDPEDNQGRLAPDGSFLFSGVPPGKYLLYFASGMASDISPLPKPIKLTVKDKDIDRLKVDIGPALW